MELSGYKITSEIGKGGMATVYLAIQESLNRPVALKVMASALAADHNFSERFLREAHTVGQLNHPHIVSIYDIGVADHYHYIAMEYVDNGDLKQRLQSGQMPVDEALSTVSQIAKALGYAHSKGFVHRDIKPENILFREDGSAVLSDFGIAKAVDSSTRMTSTGMSIGTPHYMSPEQAQGKIDIDGRSDLYSLGIVFYEMLTGKVPFEADNTIGVAMQHVQAPIPELSSNLSKYQPLLDYLLAKQAGQRYQSATELIKEVDQLQSGACLQRPVHAAQVMASPGIESPVTARNVSPQSDGLKWGVGGALLAAIIASGLYVWQQTKISRVVTGGVGRAVSQQSAISSTTSSVQLEKEKPIEQVFVQPEQEPEMKEEINKQKIMHVINDYIYASSNNDMQMLLMLYGDKVDYFGAGIVSKNFIYNDKSSYYKRWNRITYKFIQLLDVVSLDGKKSSMVSYLISFDVYSTNRRKGVRGTARNTIVLESQHGEVRIISDKQEIINKERY